MVISSRSTFDEIVRSYATHIESKILLGWEPTFMSFMYNPLNGSPSAVAEQMRFEVERIYGILLTHRSRRPSKTPRDRLPFFMACPDFPVPKYERDRFSAISINHGRHLHALDLSPPRTRTASNLADIVAERQSLLAGHNRPLSHVYAETMTGSPEEATAYVMKAIGRGRASLDDLIIMPRASGEARYGRLFQN